MLPDVPPELLVRGGAVGIVVAIVYMVLRGLLVPRRVLEDVQRERDEWRQVALSAMSQNGQLLQGTRVVSDVLQALPRPTEHPHGGDFASRIGDAITRGGGDKQ